jgi:hypothetical protein
MARAAITQIIKIREETAGIFTVHLRGSIFGTEVPGGGMEANIGVTLTGAEFVADQLGVKVKTEVVRHAAALGFTVALAGVRVLVIG